MSEIGSPTPREVASWMTPNGDTVASVYNYAGGFPEQFKKSGYKQWPNPFRNAPKDIKVLACQDTWQAQIQMYGLGLGAFLWTTAVPQPTEIIRKNATGSYKCGFYFLDDLPNPLELAFEDEVIGAFAEMVRPVVTGLFYIWAAETVFGALDAWQSLVFAQEMCNLDHGETLLAEGSGSLFFESGVGSPGFYRTLWDPEHHYSWPGGDVEWHSRKYVASNAVGHILAGGAAVDNIRMFFARGSLEPAEGSTVFETGPMNIGDVASWSLEFGAIEEPGTLEIVIEYQQHHTALQRSTVLVQRWTTTFRQAPHQPCTRWKPTVLPNVGGI